MSLFCNRFLLLSFLPSVVEAALLSRVERLQSRSTYASSTDYPTPTGNESAYDMGIFVVTGLTLEHKIVSLCAISEGNGCHGSRPTMGC
ncbi:unnamed protein product [Amoebophrya sp. A25]|nr:unnamed protein product [Amoebophrya sp. A25]|eukprot:GSA25T00027110001.1